ncbi:phage major capsid protein [Heyndrickxia coagulans]|uniref:phage major capsid protein n=1 Tax=Heyndrickxia coagulans TaxID=1398 RepID=UPI0014528B07|nr:phage major capsid protein [Heyndrickxia coagulans]MED4492824.1 phage major capsid protein [Heyndrickxia coagulans]MED4535003.1 phage major capsid protein [Heyndrickxia coagulans]QJE31808.1 phage major capsid protein [Heyndrickxia coagulans]
MPIKNLDHEQQQTAEQKENLLNAMRAGDEESFAAAMVEFANGIQSTILQEAKQTASQQFNDQQVLAKRGMQILTSEETKYYNAVIANEGFAGVEELVPPTVIERVFDELTRSHDLLNEITFVNTTGITQWITKRGDVNPAYWGKLTDAIKELLDDGFETIQTNLYKLSAFIPVAKSMLDLGPTWLDQYVRTVLAESMAIALEDAVINGTGKEMPIGMMKDLAGAVVDGVYPDKEAMAITDLSPATLGEKVMYPLTHDGKRTVPSVLLVVNPADYWAKIFPATTILTQNGTYVYGVLPIPAKIIQSVSVPTGKMVAGLAKDYFLGVGSSRSIEVAKELRILEDQDVYVTKQYANGKPVDNNAFLVFDISGVKVAP